MGTEILNFYCNKVKKTWKTAFYSTFIIGFLVHMYKFTNTLLNHDSVYNFYADQNVLGSGRWFLSIACGISSYFDLPWVTGLLSIIFIALTSVVIIDIFKMDNPVVIILTGGILVTFPAVTETFYFGFTADGYMLAMLLAALAVRFSLFGDKKKLHIFLSVCFICLCCGIYQAYVSFALVLALCYFMMVQLNSGHKIKEYMGWIGKQAFIYGAGLSLYFIIWKVCMHFQNVSANSYKGIDKVGFSFSTVVKAVPSAIRSCVLFFLEWNVLEHGVTVYSLLNIVFFLFAFAVIIVAVCKTKIYKRPAALILFFACITAVPFVVCMWQFTSSDVVYGMRMLQSLSIIYILVVVLAEKYSPKKLCNASGLLIFIIVFNFGLQANISYWFLNKSNQATYATGIEMVSRIHMLDTKANSIAVIGESRDLTSSAYLLNYKKLHNLGSGLETDLMFDYGHTVYYLNGMFNLDLERVSNDRLKEIADISEVKQMDCWPEPNSVKVIDNIIVIKLSEDFLPD